VTHKCLDAAIVQEFEVFDHGDRTESQIDRLALLAQQFGKLLDQSDLRVFGHPDHESAAGVQWIKCRRISQRVFNLAERTLYRAGQLSRARRRFHPPRCPHEKSVFKQVAQTYQSRAHRRLRQADLIAGSCDGALGEDGVENLQQVEVHCFEIVRHICFAPASRAPRSAGVAIHRSAAKAASTRSGVMGVCLNLMPVSSAKALLPAGATSRVANCPAPVGFAPPDMTLTRISGSSGIFGRASTDTCFPLTLKVVHISRLNAWRTVLSDRAAISDRRKTTLVR
jgi:hypothetical protein